MDGAVDASYGVCKTLFAVRYLQSKRMHAYYQCSQHKRGVKWLYVWNLLVGIHIIKFLM
jgi:hypothetical protein